ncbi:hypothetical protein CMUS01_13984 [Colletotrichum musicola]|uniref:Uncharacterized protein n=1 Tax=Colletotrichum musicola TaxID=2175873 RepID=A0A8H6J8E8_9PEZI|nr:hypothetical protein CMUS01_13984 [Colletotrichum musicola]
MLQPPSHISRADDIFHQGTDLRVHGFQQATRLIEPDGWLPVSAPHTSRTTELRFITSGETARSDIGLAAWPGQGYEGMALGDMKAPRHASFAVATGIHGTLSPSRRWDRTLAINLTGRTSSSSRVKAPSCRRRMQQEAGVASEVDDLKINAFGSEGIAGRALALYRACCASRGAHVVVRPATTTEPQASESRLGRSLMTVDVEEHASRNLQWHSARYIQRDAVQGRPVPTTRQQSLPVHLCHHHLVSALTCDGVPAPVDTEISESEQRPQQLIQIFPVELVARKPTSVVALSWRSASKLYQVKQTTDGIDEPIIRTQGAPGRKSAAAISHLIARGDPVGIPSQAEWRTQTQDVTRPNEEAISAGSLVWFFVATRSQQRTHLSTWRLDVVSTRGIGPGYASAFSLEAGSLSRLSPERHPARSSHFDERQDDTREWWTQEADKIACLQNRKTRPCHPWHPISSRLSGSVFHSINHGREPSRVTQRRFRFGQDRSCVDQLPAASRTLGASATAATNNLPDAGVQALPRVYG